MRGTRLRDFTLAETDTHKGNCKLAKVNKCGRCRYLDFMAKEHDLTFARANNTIFLFVCMSLAAGVIGYIRGSRTDAGAA